MARHKNQPWNCETGRNADGTTFITNADAQLATLMDIRDELQEMNARFRCQNFTSLPGMVQATRRAIEGLRRDLKAKTHKARKGKDQS